MGVAYSLKSRTHQVRMSKSYAKLRSRRLMGRHCRRKTFFPCDQHNSVESENIILELLSGNHVYARTTERLSQVHIIFVCESRP